jgi:dethiobiotin synthetase
MNKIIQRGLFVTGTDTGVGKTHIAAKMAHLLNLRGLVVRPRKPVESGCLRGEDELIPADAATLKVAAGSNEVLTHICPYRYESALSPERAASLVGQSLTLDDLVTVCHQGVSDKDFLLVEGAGGFYSPLACGVLNADLAVALSLPVLLIVPDRLGAINQTLLAVEAIKNRGLTLAAVILNQNIPGTNPQMNNAVELSRWLGKSVLTTAYFRADSAKSSWLSPCAVLAFFVDTLTGSL